MQQESSERLKVLAEMANDFNVNKGYPIRRYYRSGEEMLKMGNVYYQEENYEKAYVLYLKYLTLFVEKICLHPEYKSVPAADKTRISRNAKEVVAKSEKIKKALKARYDEEHRLWKLEEEERRRQREQEETKKKLAEGQRLREELSKYHEEKEKSIAIQRDYETALYEQFLADKALEQEQLELTIQESLKEQKEKEPQAGGSGAVIPQFDRGSKPNTSSSPAAFQQHPSVPDRSIKPNSSSSSSLGLYSRQDQSGLRRVRVPHMVMGKFLSVAQSNTAKNVETCAVLAGKLANNQFLITHVLVPKQKGTPDSCATMGEEELFEYQDKHELITLGWIHTHPTQTAFLSSVDLHTHLAYQLMLPEAIAIVCSPKFDETGFFVLTQNFGLDYIGSCRESGFHPHPKEPPLFEEGAHVDLDQNADVTLVDLR